MDNLSNAYYKFAKEVKPLVEVISNDVSKMVNIVVATFNENTGKEFMAFSDYIPATVKKAKSKETTELLTSAREALAGLKKIKAALRNPDVQVPNKILFDFVVDGGIVNEVNDIFKFYETNKSVNPYNEYLESVKRYLVELEEIIKVGENPDYYQYIKDNSGAKF